MGETETLTILSLGAGVQSSAMALLYAHGELKPMPDAAVFADTQWEPNAVYHHLDWLMSPNVLPFPVYRVTKSNIRSDLTDKALKKQFSDIPWFTTSGGMGRRQCTKIYKIYPIRDVSKRLYFEKTGADPSKRIPPGAIECLIGISIDEASRMKPTSVKYMVNRWPLIELSMSRRDCLRWMEQHEYPIPAKSSCIGCPYHSNDHWRDMRDNDPESWGDAVEIDKIIRDGRTSATQYMHRSLIPLNEADLRTHAERGQPDLFNEECEGMCGV